MKKKRVENIEKNIRDTRRREEKSLLGESQKRKRMHVNQYLKR